MSEPLLILHLCADIGSDSLFYRRDPRSMCCAGFAEDFCRVNP